ncbi:MAG: Mth938-like domain-containing protein [Thiomargarita sp.]|nr:Mth938-like domain-containing protein [Thiomargarita sp.]
MNINLDTSEATYHIQRIESHSVTINDKVYTQSMIIMPESLTSWAVDDFDHLEVAHFQTLLALNPGVVLLGTGQNIRFPAPELLAPLINKGIGVEVMDTAAACRTYTILMAEGRGVAAALIID